MKKLLSQILILNALVLFGGCVTSPTERSDYAADTNTISAWREAAHVVNRSIPANPVSGIADLAIDGTAALVTAASLLYARKRNESAKSHASAADTLAELVVRSGLSTQALQIASANGAIESVARHIDQNTPGEIAPK